MTLRKSINLLFPISLIFLSACTKSEADQQMAKVVNSPEAQVIRKKTYSPDDIDPLATTVVRLHAVMSKHKGTKPAEDAKLFLEAIADRGVKLHRNMKRDLETYSQSIAGNLLPVVGEVTQLSQKVIDHYNNRDYFDKVKVKKDQCRAFYFGRELDKNKLKLVLVKVTQVGKQEIKGKVILDTRHFKLGSIDRFLKKIDEERQFYNFEVKKSIKLDCNKAYSYQMNYLEQAESIKEFAQTKKLMKLLRTYLALAGASSGQMN